MTQKLNQVLKYFIIFISISFLLNETLSFVSYTVFMILFIYFSESAMQDKKKVYYSVWIKYSCISFFSYFIIQLIPFPHIILKELSGYSSKLLIAVSKTIPKFHSISIIPFETFFLGVEIFILVFFGYRLFIMKWNMKEIISLIEVIIFSVLIKFLFSVLFAFIKNEGEFQNYLSNNGEIKFSLFLLIPLSLGLIFYKIEFLRSSAGFFERFKLFCNNSNYWFFYILSLIIPLFVLIVWGMAWDIFISFFCLLIFFSLIIYLKQQKKRRKLLKPVLLIVLLSIFFIGLFKINNPIIIKMGTNTIQTGSIPSLSATGIGIGASKVITPSLLSYIGEKRQAEIRVSSMFFLESGLIGISVFGFFLFFLFLSIIKMLKVRKHPDIKILGVALITTLIITFILGLDNFIYFLRYYRFTIVLILVITFKLLLYKKDFFDEKQK